MLRFSFWYARVEWWILVSLLVAIPAFAQDASTGAIRGTVVDSAGRPIVDASIALVDSAQGFRYFVTSDAAGQSVRVPAVWRIRRTRRRTGHVAPNHAQAACRYRRHYST